MRRVLFLRDGGLGDCLFVLPLIESVRAAYPGAEIVYAATRRFLPVLALSVARPTCVAIEATVSHLLFAANPPDSVLQPLTGYDRVFTFHGDEQFLRNAQQAGVVRYLDPRPSDHIVSHLSRILDEDRIPLVTEVPSLRTHGRPSDPSCVFIHPGGGTGRKRWPVSNYAPLLGGLRERFPGIRPVLLLGEAEADLSGQLSCLFDEVVDRAPLETLPASLADRRYLGMDSGITHLAAASNARVLALFGPTDPRIWAQRRSNYNYLHAAQTEQLDCQEVLDRIASLIRHETD
ncbi:MAG: glycosyltransferase family 9 protein [Acidobacteriota bacterium]